MNQQPSSGYTIIEVMIFLAISAALFVGAAVAVGGRQEEVQYSQAVRDFESQIADAVNDVANGYYPTFSGSCAYSVGGAVTFKTTASDPGTNELCVNVGKTLMFNVDGDDSRFGVGTIVGKNLLLGSGAAGQVTFASLDPTLAFQEGGSAADDATLDLTEYKPIRFGARVTRISDVETTTREFSSINFITGFTSSSPDKSGTLTTNMYTPETGFVLSADRSVADFKTEVEALSDTTPSNIGDSNAVEGGIFICLTTNNDRRARIIIGESRDPSSIRSEFDVDTSVCP